MARVALFFSGCMLSIMLAMVQSTAAAPGKPTVIRVGYFPNITHAQALVARQLSRQGKGWFEERLGQGVEIRWFTYNAGPSAMEAMFANSLDLTYVGPNPALNAYMRSRGKAVRILAGSAQGGAGLVVQKDINKPADFKGKKIATPQFGNTQDVSCRVWLGEQGFKITMRGGDVQVIPTPNPDQLGLFQRGQVSGVWTVEPWVSRLEMEAGGKVFLLEDQAITTIVAARAGFLQEQRDLAKKFLEAHVALTQWINEHKEEAQKLARAELTELMRRDFPENLLQRAWGRLRFNSAISVEAFEKLVKEAQSTGFLKDVVPLKDFIQAP